MESEYIAMSEAVNEMRVLRNLLLDLIDNIDVGLLYNSNQEGIDNIKKSAQVLQSDNQSAICVGNATAATRRSRHINNKYHNVKEAKQDGEITLQWVASADNLADFFTKCLGGEIFHFLRGILMFD